MALKLRRQAGIFTNGILQRRSTGDDPQSLRTGAGSFKRVLGGRPTGPASQPTAHSSPREYHSEKRKHDGTNVCTLPAGSCVGQRTCDGEKTHRVEDEEGAQSEQHYCESAHT